MGTESGEHEWLTTQSAASGKVSELRDFYVEGTVGQEAAARVLIVISWDRCLAAARSVCDLSRVVVGAARLALC